MTTPDVQRRLAAILSADVAGYSRLMGDDEEATVETLTQYREVFLSLIRTHRGTVVDAKGDAILAEFASVVDAVNAAVDIQRDLGERNSRLSDQRRMDFRIGINLGDVIVKDGVLYGDGVNIAARVESLADPGGICLSGSVYAQVRNKVPLDYRFLGKKEVKNIAEPVPVYWIEPGKPGEQPAKRKREDVSFDSPEPALPDGPSIAVLAFENMSGDPEQEYFSDGITEDIITDLSKISDLFVIARNSSFSYKGRNVPVQQVGREMGVRYVLEGSVRKAGNKVRITAQLVEAETGKHLWAERYDRDLEDIFAVQDEITDEVVTALDVKLIAGEQARIWRNSLKNPRTREYYYRARENYHHLSHESQIQARHYFSQVISAEPDSPLGYVGEAWSHWYEAFRGWGTDPAKALERSEELVRKALTLDDLNSEAHVMLGAIHCVNGAYEQAIAEGERAVALGPNMADVSVYLGMILYLSSRFEEALVMINRAMRLCPVCPGVYQVLLGQSLNLLERYDEAIEAYQKAAVLEPDYPTSHFGLAVSFSALGRNEEAHTAAEQFRKVSPHVPSLREYAKRHPFKDPAVNERWIGALQKAGIE